MTGPRRIWVVGGMAWDTVLHVDSYPERGGYARGSRLIERPGGSAGNVARAVASSGVPCGFATTLGNDAMGRDLNQVLAASGLDTVKVSWVDTPTEHVLVVVDSEGDRTLFGLAHHSGGVGSLDGVALDPGDIVVFVVWEDVFRDSLRQAQRAGCTVFVGIHALLDPEVRADVAFGSRSDLPPGTDVTAHLDRFDRVVLTRGSEGATQFARNSRIDQSAIAATVVDATGAGDAFLAGYLVVYAHGATSGVAALDAGARWASAAIGSESSVPPPWPSVPGLSELIPDFPPSTPTDADN